MSRRRRPIRVGLALALVLAACARDAGEPAAPDPIGWSDCGDDLLCTTVVVPVDHRDPDGPTVDLAVAMRPATDGERRLGVLLTNPGGPGASGIDALRSGPALPVGTLERFDVVSWDPRGVGPSTPVDCGGELASFLALDPRPEAADRVLLDRRAPAVVESCAAGSGRLLEHVSTGDHAQDMEALRVALGERSISFLGLSYGTRLGLEYLRRHPDRVDTMILDSVVAPEVSVDELVRAQAREFEGVAASLTARAPASTAAVRDAAEEARLEGREGPVTPVRVDRAVVLAGYDPALARRTLEGLRAAADGDGRALDEQGRRYEESIDLDAYLATTCADGGGPRGAAAWDALERDVLAAAPTVGPVVVNELRPCAFWPTTAQVPTRAGPDAEDAAGSAVLLLANTDDPVTPVGWARMVARALPSAALVTIGEEGHIALDGSACARELAGRVLLTGSIPGGAKCA